MPNVQEKSEPHTRVDANALFGSSMVTWIAIELMSRWYEGAQVRARSRVATGA